MKLLKCRQCSGEMDIVGNERAVNKKVKCRQCGFTNANETATAFPEVIVIRKSKHSNGSNN